MNITRTLTVAAHMALASAVCGLTLPVPDRVVSETFAGRTGALVLIDCASDASSDFRPDASAEKLAPCSTFKIWNTLIGLETGMVKSADEAFYKWDGETRAVSDWNKDLTLKEAFQASCVPAFQNMARKIGSVRMQSWLDKIGYGDRDMSAGADVFWLPAKGRKTILISPREQARLMCKLVSGKLPFSEHSLAALREMMTVRKTHRGVLYGKTGSGADDNGTYNLGWFVGYAESKGRTYAFACVVKGEGVQGKDARAIVEKVLEVPGLL